MRGKCLRNVHFYAAYGNYFGKVFCNICDKLSFKSIGGLVSHLKNKHPKQKSDYNCADYCDFEENNCDEKFKKYQDLIIHIKKHLKAYQKTLVFKCTRCDKLCETSKILKRHERQVHDKLYPPSRFLFHIQKCSKGLGEVAKFLSIGFLVKI